MEEQLNFSCDAVPRLAAAMITRGKTARVSIEIDGQDHTMQLAGRVDGYGAGVHYLPHKQHYSYPSSAYSTYLTVTLGHSSHGTKVMFNAATGELIGPRNITREQASHYATALTAMAEGEACDGEINLDTVGRYSERKLFIDHSIPLMFGPGSTAYLFGKMDELFPFPEGFQPFHIAVIPGDHRYRVEVKNPSDILHTFRNVLHHGSHTDLEPAFAALRSLSPDLEEEVRLTFERASSGGAVRTSMRC